MKINPNRLNSSVVYNINSASHKNPNAVLGSIELNLAIKTKDGDDQLIRQKCLILRPELKLGIVLLGEDFLMTNNVGIKYDLSTSSMLIDINGETVTLLTDKMEGNLKSYYPSTFLTATMLIQVAKKSRV